MSKRTRDASEPNQQQQDASSSQPPSAKRQATRRPKSSQACVSCRKHKTRCELLDSTSYIARCHRCEVLSIPCSFETDAPRSIVFNDPQPLSKIRQNTAKALLATSKSHRGPDPTGIESGSSASEDEESPWDFLTVPGLTDWTSTPILGMRILSRQACPDSFPKYTGTASCLADVLSSEQKNWLLNFFEKHYEPWLSLPAHTLVDDEILDLVRCSIASRHLEPLARAQVFPPMRHLVEQVIMQHVFNPTPTMAVVQAFAILSLWSPFDNLPPSAGGSHDSRLIAASAVSMGRTLGLHESEDRALALQQRLVKGGQLTVQEANDYPQLMNKCNVWMLLRVVESMACIGTGRPLTAALAEDIDMKRFGTLSDTLENVRRTRMLVTNRIFQLADKGLKFDMPDNPDEYDAFYDDLTELSMRFEILDRIFIGLPVASDFDTFWLQVFKVYYYNCRLVVLVHIIRLLRTHVPKATCSNGFLQAKFRRTGAMHAIKCARVCLIVSDGTLATLLSVTDKDLLATAPDAFFSMVAFAAAFLIMSKFMILKSQNQRRMPGCTDQLLDRSIALLNRVATGPDHPAARCAKVMQDFVDSWNTRLAQYDAECASSGGHSGSGELQLPRDGMGTSSGSTPGTDTTMPTPIEIAGDFPGPSTDALGSGGSLNDFNFGFENAFGLGGQDNMLGDMFWQSITELPQVPLPNYTYNFPPGPAPTGPHPR
ncbi:hypothetical protein PENSPDRAFT_646607 [Peniophora sp. CONT]|nr:hypothetical protein PENSPDRAFT_646607 [Peniophora sp. CONT]